MFSPWKRRKRRVVLAAIIIALVVVWAWSRWDRRPPDIREYFRGPGGMGDDPNPDQPSDEGAIRESLARNQPEVSGHRRWVVRLAGGRGRPDTSEGKKPSKRSPGNWRLRTSIESPRHSSGTRVGGSRWNSLPQPFSTATAIPGPPSDWPVARGRLYDHRAIGTRPPGTAAALHRSRGPDRGSIRR